MDSQTVGASFSRRGVLGMTGGAAIAAALAACSSSGGSKSGGGGGGGKSLKFWNMPWGGTAFNPLDKKITLAYKPASGLPSATYQEIQWANFTQTFASAIASRTGPAVSSGGGTQAFQFAHQGQIAYADNLLDSWKKNGIYDDFFPGLVDTMKTDKGYAGVPYNLDVRVSWYNKSLLAKAGVEPPTTWAEYENVCAKLKKIGVYGFGLGAGTGNNIMAHILTAFMINNGGGLFNAKQEPDCASDANVEAVEFVLGLVKKGYSDPAAATYTTANVYAQWTAKKFGMGWDTAGAAVSVGGAVAKDMVVGVPLASTSGKKGGLYFPNNIMMYTNTPSQKGSEAFLTYYFQTMKSLWTQNTGIGLPPLKSITTTSQFKADPNSVKIVDDWQPIFKTWAAPGGTGLFYNIANTVDGTAPMNNFAQSILGGKVSAKAALSTLQSAIEPLMT
ncbi:ABC transporter substrate-binding protein [Allobranchiibius sp. CTAmp26]|uniref:ABC transporter substrate-binding protein n=1 Tax=Allobranchiibius sp. CTAmp26 TaxID=2815214 RepID=UPI001AA1151C|nr:extracellular solute-binding protein [Allobranchiibius sp. CTAmp26]MBO1755357.1 extracellular solute-binding protein [Allobranchiibius sp. CTAmp26]